jgi:hypothetical protein
MKVLCLYILSLFLIQNFAIAQDVYFKSGLNNTRYDFKDEEGKKQKYYSGMGSSFEFGVGIPFHSQWFRYEGGVSIDNYNASGGDVNNNYSWNTTYAGLKNTVTFFPTIKDLDIGVMGILGVSSIVHGNQVINNSRYKVSNHPEFKGVLIQSGLGVSSTYNIFREILLHLSYDFTKSYRIGEFTPEKLSYTNHRVQFGVRFMIN